MNFLELVTKRCSIRRFASTPVEIEKIEYILEAARLSPSAVNFQPWTFVVVQQESKSYTIAIRVSGLNRPLFILLFADIMTNHGKEVPMAKTFWMLMQLSRPNIFALQQPN